MRPIPLTYEIGELIIKSLRAEAESSETRRRSAELRWSWRDDPALSQVPELRSARLVEQANLLVEQLEFELACWKNDTGT
jgi:hypothetical protein